MPLYEYVCQSCETRFEKLVKRFGEQVACPSCASDAVDKQLSVFAVAGSSAPSDFAGCEAGSCGDGGCDSGGCGGGACRYPS
jgi:putative FmdB family regulatory protein